MISLVLVMIMSLSYVGIDIDRKEMRSVQGILYLRMQEEF